MKPRMGAPGNRNLVGTKVVAMRKKLGLSQKDFLARLQVHGMEISATSLSRLEGQYRLVTDHEIVIIAKVLNVEPNDLLI